MESPWRSFVPHHVLRELARHPRRSPIGREQRMAVVALFADVSGFTAVSEALARTGKHSAEELTAILNRYFEPMIALVESYGGIIGKFGGDAMTILFPFAPDSQAATVRRAIQCAAAMQGRMGDYVDMPTSVGAFSLAMKAGLAMGEVLCTTVGDPAARLEYIIAGRVLDECAEAEHHASKGEIVTHNALLPFADPLVVEVRGDFTCVAGLRAPEPPEPLADLKPPTTKAIATIAAYLHPTLAAGLRANQAGFINEHRHVAVMFVRFGGFDYDGDPQVCTRLQAYFAAVIERIQRYDGYLNKIDMGDKGSKYIVLFGAPVAHEDDAERALRCALELRDLAPATTAIGLNAGLVFCGLVGSDRRQEYTVMGDPVNLAARLMQAAGAGQIMVGDQVRQAAAAPFAWGAPRELQVKGKSAPVAVWALEGVGQEAAPRMSEPHYSLPLVGRQAELALAAERLRQVAAGHPAIIGITAEAGMGKSRLGSAVIDQARQQGMAIFAGACQSFGTRTGYLVWHTIWRDFFALDAHGDVAGHSARLSQELARIDPRLLPRLPLLGPVLNLPLPENEFTRALDGQLRTELTRALLLACLRHRAARQPLLFVLEDMHWSDSLSLDLLEFLARVGDNHPVGFLVIYRLLDGDHPIKRLMRLGHASEIALAEFSPAEAASLIRLKLTQHFGAAQAMPEVLVERLSSRAGGNPFFIEELLNYIRDRGIDPSDTAAVAALDLPNSLHNVIISRIDQLLSEEKITLKVASVIGRLFRARWLWGGYPSLGSPDAVKGRLDTLSELDLTPLDRPEPELEYIFKHITTQEVAYESLALATRTQLHGAIAAFIERAYPDQLEQYISLLAFHYGRSADTAKQVTYFRLAADQAKANYANAVAIEYYTRLLPLLPPAERAAVQRERGEVRQLIGQWPEAEADYRQAMALAQTHDDAATAARAQTLLGRLLAQTASHAAALAWLEPARATFERLGDAAGLGAALEHLSFVYSEQGQFAAALETAERHLALARARGDSRGVSTALGNIGLVHSQRGDLEQALAAQQQALEVATEQRDWRRMVVSNNDLAHTHWRRGDIYNAILSLQHATSVAHEIDYREAFAFALGNMGLLYFEQGFFDQALACYSHALSIFIELGAWANALASISNVGLYWREHQDASKAETCYRYALVIAEKLNNQSRMAGLYFYLAQIFYRQRLFEQAQRANRQALELAVATQRGDIAFQAEVLAIMVAWTQGASTGGQSRAALVTMADSHPNPEHQAALYFAMWEIDNGDDQARHKASALYHEHYERAGHYNDRQRYQQLTGEWLPQRYQAPALPTFLDPHPDRDLMALIASIPQLLN